MAVNLDRARDAFDAGTWGEAFSRFSSADAEHPLEPKDLERFAVAAHLVGEDDLSVATWERAHLQLLESGDVERAVRCAFWLASGLLSRGHMASGGGWIGRADRLIEDHELDCVEQGFLLIPRGLRSLEEGDPARAHQIFGDAVAVGERFGEADLVTLGRLGQGRSLIVMGRDAEGVALLDEAMVAVTVEEVTPIVAGRVYCAVILVCQQAFDVKRAHEWTAALSKWCDAQPDMVPFRGQCLVHRSEVLQWHGEWSKALDEAKRARDRLSEPDHPAIGMAFYQLGELYRLRGDFVDAEAAYREANRYGRAPQPGLACLRMMQGDLDSAEAAIGRILSEPSDRVTRAKLLSAGVEIMLEAGNANAAEEAARELTVSARRSGAPVLHAMAMHAAAALSRHRGDPRAAFDAAQQATSAWTDLEAPYEHARSRLLGALACSDLGDRETAHLEADAARQIFERLGATPDIGRLETLLSGAASAPAGNLTKRQIEVLVQVAAGKANREIADELTISEHTVRRHLQDIFHKVGVNSRAAATAYAYEHGLV